MKARLSRILTRSILYNLFKGRAVVDEDEKRSAEIRKFVRGALWQIPSLVVTLGLAFFAVTHSQQIGRFLATVAGSTQGDSSDFSLSTRHDEFDGDVTEAQKNVSNSSGVEAQVTLRCVSTKNTDALAAVQNLFGSAPSALVDAMVGLKRGCPEGFTCNAEAEIAFFGADGKAVKVTTTAMNSAASEVPYQVKNENGGSVANYITTLEISGSTSYNNAVVIPVPTFGGSFTRWVYRFNVVGDDTPIDIPIPYTSPNVSKLVGICNDQHPPPIEKQQHVQYDSQGHPIDLDRNYGPVRADSDVPQTIGPTTQQQTDLAKLQARIQRNLAGNAKTIADAQATDWTAENQEDFDNSSSMRDFLTGTFASNAATATGIIICTKAMTVPTMEAALYFAGKASQAQTKPLMRSYVRAFANLASGDAPKNLCLMQAVSYIGVYSQSTFPEEIASLQSSINDLAPAGIRRFDEHASLFWSPAGTDLTKAAEDAYCSDAELFWHFTQDDVRQMC